jgi:hypothetical protein
MTNGRMRGVTKEEENNVRLASSIGRSDWDI